MIKKTNKAFRELEETEGTNKYIFDVNELNKLFNKKIKKVKDISLIVEINDKKNWNLIEDKMDEVILSDYLNKTDYEATENEMLVIDDISKSDIRIEDQIKLGIILMNDLKEKKNFPEKNVFYFSVDQNILTLRFHEYREKEGLWISNELEGFNQPVAYFICK